MRSGLGTRDSGLGAQRAADALLRPSARAFTSPESRVPSPVSIESRVPSPGSTEANA
ncbi:hypothetical protein KM539_16605 [Xanthomonas translucens pv. poae]|uniref:hypothetical protein n=1 Tax=Xanthomonas graminis TaxID=3390026 RepID=UPI000AE943C4|nr:hypothetical protein [Xanthomonas translucens]UKE61335.1 hypothetical protein KM539_16605 [Xanthomonas translucens pv. poae]